MRNLFPSNVSTKHSFSLYLIVLLLLTCPLLLSASTNSSHQDTSSPTLDEQLLWGTYKPHLISALTQRSTHPITVGFAYSETFFPKPSLDEFKENLRFRMSREMIAQFTHHNGFDFSREAVLDDPLKLFYDLSFLKEISPSDSTQQWYYSVYGVDQNYQQDKWSPQTSGKDRFSTYMYIALEDLEGDDDSDPRYLQIVENVDQEDSTVLQVWNTATGAAEGFFRISVMYAKNKRDGTPTVKGIYKCMVYDYNKTKTWKVEDILYSRLDTDVFRGLTHFDQTSCREDTQQPGANFFGLQVISDAVFHLVISYNSKEIPAPIDLTQLQKAMQNKEREFQAELDAKLPIRNLNKYRFDLPKIFEIQQFALSNLLGGILYSYGSIKIQGDEPGDYVETEKKELFSASPSRVGFPRGFLWDEGFHQTVICSWNKALCMDMLGKWLDTIEESGWIPREQARGEKLESNFKQIAFLHQSQQEANPPSMIIPILKLLDSVVEERKENKEEVASEDRSKKEVKKFLGEVLPKLRSWFSWLVKTQENKRILGKRQERGSAVLLEANETNVGSNNESISANNTQENQSREQNMRSKYFSWTCKYPCEGKYLGSGLDDYPRHFGDYRGIAHIDLHMWLLAFARGILAVEDLIEGSQSEDIAAIEKTLVEGLEEFIDPSDRLLKDLILHRGDKDLRNRQFSEHKGYVNLFPAFFGALKPNSAELAALIELVSSHDHLWSAYGIRSLSKSDPYFMDGGSYWTEPIWMPMNFLLLRGLKKYYFDNEEVRQLYEALRENLVKLMSLNWDLDANFWENFDSFTGLGKGFPNFTGWTSLVVLIYAEQYS